MTQSRTTARVATNAVLKGLAAAGAVTGVVIAPNSAKLIESHLSALKKRDAERTLTYLKYRKLVSVKEAGGKLHYKLTSKGRDKYESIILDELAVKLPKQWDHKWRVVMFDIPTNHRQQHDELLAKLKSMKFYMLQQSAWIHPFECEKQIGVLLDTLGLNQYVSYLVVEKGNFSDHATAYFKRQKLLV